MAHILRLEITGFQSHALSTVLEFSPGLTVITGESGFGKTSIIRALKWLALNEPKGEDFVHVDTGYAKVEVTMSDRRIISKQRRKGKTEYRVSGYDNPFNTADTPAEVSEILAIYRQTFGDFEAWLNFSFQLEGPFLISESPSAGAKVLGKLAGTELVDKATKQVSRDTHAFRQQRLEADKIVEQREADLIQYATLERDQDVLNMAKDLYEEADSHVKTQERMGELSKRWETAKVLHENAARRMEQCQLILSYDQQVLDIQAKQLQYTHMQQLLARYEENKLRYAEAVERMDNLSALPVVNDLFAQIQGHAAMGSQLQGLIRPYRGAASRLAEALSVLESAGDIPTLQQDIEVAQALAVELESYTKLHSAYNGARTSFERYEKSLLSTEHHEEARQLVNQATLLSQRIRELDNLSVKYGSRLTIYKAAVHDAEAATLRVEIQEKQRKELWDSLDVCPLCEQQIEHAH